MKVIVGLGNPGRQYEDNRHNVGFRVIDLLARRWSIGLDREKHQGRFGSGIVDDEKVVLLQPLTFMNRSGATVGHALRFYQALPSDLMVIVDDMALALGRLRLRASGSAGGHNGLQDIIECLGDDGFNRLRVGIGPPGGVDAIGHVLGDFSQAEEEVLEELLPRAADAVSCWLATGMDEAMTRYNQRPKSEDKTEEKNNS